MPRLRLGVALLLPAPIAAEVDTLRRAVGDRSLARIPAHLTLVPPVNVRHDALPAALAVLRDAAAATRPFTLELGPPATFLPESPVLYLGVGGEVGELLALRERVFRGPFERTLSWPFVPHVTLADDAEPSRIGAALGALCDYRATAEFDRVVVLREQDRVWSPWADARFGAPAVLARGGLELEISEATRLDPLTRAWLDAQWERFDRDRFRGEAWREEPFALTARRGEEVVGVATGWTNLGVGFLGELVVGEAVRGEGVGSHLLAAFEHLARRRGCRRLALHTQAGSDAQRFYEARGWYVEASLPDWWGGLTWVQLRRDP